MENKRLFYLIYFVALGALIKRFPLWLPKPKIAFPFVCFFETLDKQRNLSEFPSKCFEREKYPDILSSQFSGILFNYYSAHGEFSLK